MRTALQILKDQARRAVKYAVATGKLEKPDACTGCGKIGRVEAHHYMGYEREHWLTVRWLCKACHATAPRERKPISERRRPHRRKLGPPPGLSDLISRP